MARVSKRRKNKAMERGGKRAEIARRAIRILKTEPHYVYHPSFDAPDAKQLILAAPAAAATSRPAIRTAKGSDFYVAFLYQTDILSREEEFYLFRKMNYLKFLAYRLRQGIDPQTAELAQVEEIERLESEATRIRNFVIESNLRLVTARAKQFSRSTGLPLDELISEGNIGLVQAVEHFDFSRGTKLSTYATWAISNKFLAYLQRARRQSGHFGGDQTLLSDVVQLDAASVEERLADAELKERLAALISGLKERERAALEHRFGLTDGTQGQTLKDLAGQWGVTKQRAQQVCAGAVNKLRAMLQQEGFHPSMD
mgnify:CR=1 FL=1